MLAGKSIYLKSSNFYMPVVAVKISKENTRDSTTECEVFGMMSVDRITF